MRIPSLTCLALAVLIAVLPATSSAEETWAVRSGATFLEFEASRLQQLGLTVSSTAADESPWRFEVSPASDLTWGVNHNMVVPSSFSSGALLCEGRLTIGDAGSGATRVLDGFRIAADARPYSFVLADRESQEAVLELIESPLIFDAKEETFTAGRFTIRLAPAIAQAWGRSDLVGVAIGRGEIRLEGAWIRGQSEGEVPVAGADGSFKDVALGILDGMTHWDREGIYPNGTEALSMATTSCNLGDVDVPWLAPMQEDHPGISMHLYRELNGRLEMIGFSDIKHGFYALSSSQCTPCQHPSPGTWLGVGCSDTYGAGNNADRTYLAPRGEWDPYAGTWTCTGSHFAGGVMDCSRRHGSGGHGVLDHRLVAKDVDLGNPGASYWYEGYYVVRGDQYKYNNIVSRPCTMSWTGSQWSFSTTGGQIEGPRLDHWGNMRTWSGLEPSDGYAIVAVKTTDLGGGQWNYDYGVYNFDLTRAIRSFTVPVGTAVVSNIEYHDPDLDALNDWTAEVVDGAITWSTDPFEVDSLANALTYGLLYNFRFTADVEPVIGRVTLGLFRPGVPDNMSVGMMAPPAIATSVPVTMNGTVLDLAQNQPNPVGSGTTFRFTLPQSGPAQLEIYDTRGRHVRTLVRESQEAGSHEVRWDVSDESGQRVAPGVYYYRLRAGGEVLVRSLVVVM